MDNPATTAAPTAVPRLTVRLLLNEVGERFLNLERGWLRTARELTTGPGAMIRRYVTERRKVYANPFAYLVAGSAVNILIQKTVGFQKRLIATAQSSGLESPLQMEFTSQFADLVLQNTLYVSLGILVPLSLLFRLLFRKSDYNLAECFVFALYSGGHVALFNVILVPFYMLLPPSTAIQGIVGLSVATAYTAYAARGFFSGSSVAVVLKTCAAYGMAYLSFMVVMLACTLAYIFLVIAPTPSGEVWDLVTATDYEVIQIVEKLLNEGADANSTVQRNALHAAAENGNLPIVELLIDHGADVNLQDIHGRVPLFVALVKNQPEVARRLAEASTDAKTCTIDGSSLLMAALWAEDEEMVVWALENGVDVNASRPTKDHATALMIAASEGEMVLVDLLLRHGADPSLTNRDGKTAFDLAKDKQVKELLRVRSGS